MVESYTFNNIRSSNGVAIAINPKTGEILSLVSSRLLKTTEWRALFLHIIMNN